MFEDKPQFSQTSSCSISTNSSFSVNKPVETESCCSTQKVESKNESCCDTQDLENKEVTGIEKLKLANKKDLFIKTWNQFVTFIPYMAIGIGIGALVHGFVPQEVLTKYASADNPYAIPIAAIIGVPLYIRASSMVGIAPALLDGGVSMGAILALTIAGAGASLPEMIMLKKIFKTPIMISFILVVFTMAIGCGYLVNLYFA